jgi:hypothetical protein
MSQWLDSVTAFLLTIAYFHSAMRFELGYSKDWSSSYVRIPYTYTLRPALVDWENWRDDHAEIEINRWTAFVDFWMQGM